MKTTVETVVKASRDKVWEAWNKPDDIMQWNAAQDDWHTTRSVVDLREGGGFLSRMEAKDGSVGFDFEEVYTRVVPCELIAYRMSNGREVEIEFIDQADGVLVRETFDAETENSAEMQRDGWQSILNNFARYVEGRCLESRYAEDQGA
ncbi:ATPase [Proteobacteria bacterium 005FR1]|nr:ATPase [Proteobacteria bacterium 005FR1]